ncbi:citrate lyase holo-[acyl-carrier protein] synthase [Enterococcus gallinarum]|uniref:citrate lyase holo-[acyl-carrier protein] synthase n=1 Tax=Enterococcus gallinarum TaxID=1353 RepID=UPI0022E9783C|nr:citrate lyase holo-[acyl-carrier protein] synthase [Enterococcus gallinarum]
MYKLKVVNSLKNLDNYFEWMDLVRLNNRIVNDNVDHIIGVYDGSVLIGTGSCSKNYIVNVSVKPEFQSDFLTTKIILFLVDEFILKRKTSDVITLPISLNNLEDEVFDGLEVSLEEMLEARELRTKVQRKLLTKYPNTVLLSATLNIPGTVKNSKKLANILKIVLNTVHEKIPEERKYPGFFYDGKTGIEYYLPVKMLGFDLKKTMVEIENSLIYGRLVDLDVIFYADERLQTISRKMMNLPLRKCLVCDNEAKSCSRSRKHSIKQMRESIANILEKGSIQEND